jgi:hypothetical protein
MSDVSGGNPVKSHSPLPVSLQISSNGPPSPLPPLTPSAVPSSPLPPPPPSALPNELSALTKVTVAGQPIELSVSNVALTSDLYNLSIATNGQLSEHFPFGSTTHRRPPHKVKVNGTAFIPEQMAVAVISSSTPTKHHSDMIVGGEAPNLPVANAPSSAIVPPTPPASALNANDEPQEYCPKKFRRLAYMKKSNRHPDRSPSRADSAPEQAQPEEAGKAQRPTECAAAADQPMVEVPTGSKSINCLPTGSKSETVLLTQDAISTACELALNALAADVLSGALVQRKKRALSVTSEEEVKVKREPLSPPPMASDVGEKNTVNKMAIGKVEKTREIKKIKSETKL